ncbi:hypothetical protein Ancab_006701 [Ancistrocladus abbreviatus]
MGYEPYDSSGTDDDLPQSHHNRVQRGAHTAVNGRSGLVGSVPYSGICGESDMEAQIHHLEREAYSAVLRAFKAQADAITWEKESLITELRKELKISNEEHRELLGKVNADDVIRRVREWRQAGGVQSGMLGASQSAAHDPISSPTVSASRKKPKANQSAASQSLARPSPSFHPQVLSASNQPSSSAAEREVVIGSKGKKYKSQDQVPPGASSIKSAPYPTPGPSGRGQFSNQPAGPKSDIGGAVTCDQLVGRKVRTRWPEDNNFYEAVITDYDPEKGLHVLRYDVGTVKETWEWVNLSEISPEDIQWEGEYPGISRRGAHNIPVHGANRYVGPDGIPGAGRGRGAPKGHAKKNILPSQNGIGKKASNEIKILHTDTLIKEVERIFGTGHPSPLEVDRVKKVLREHEQSLVDAIGRIAELSDGESDDRRQFSRGQ